MPDMIESRMLTLFEKASSLILANIKMDMLDEIDQVEVKKELFWLPAFYYLSWSLPKIYFVFKRCHSSEFIIFVLVCMSPPPHLTICYVLI